jgi:hypothetical protein
VLDSAVEDVQGVRVSDALLLRMAYGLQRQSSPLRWKRSECMIDTATQGARCMLASQRLELVGFLAKRVKDLQMTNLVGGAPFLFSVSLGPLLLSSHQ